MELSSSSIDSSQAYYTDNTDVALDGTFDYSGNSVSWSDSSHTMVTYDVYPTDSIITDPINRGSFCSTPTYTLTAGSLADITYLLSDKRDSYALDNDNSISESCDDEEFSYSLVLPSPLNTPELAHAVYWDAIGNRIRVYSDNAGTLGTHTITVVG